MFQVIHGSAPDDGGGCSGGGIVVEKEWVEASAWTEFLRYLFLFIGDDGANRDGINGQEIGTREQNRGVYDKATAGGSEGGCDRIVYGDMVLVDNGKVMKSVSMLTKPKAGMSFSADSILRSDC